MSTTGEILGQGNRSISEARFGDVLRIVWTTYYFGADLQWHNARTGEVESAEVLRVEQEASCGDWEWLQSATAMVSAIDSALQLLEVLAEDPLHHDVAARIRNSITGALESA